MTEEKKTYTYEEALEASIEYFNGDEFAASNFVGKYALSNNGEYYELTPKDMHKRLAKELARIEAKYPNPMSEGEIFDLLDGFRYVCPQGSPSSAIGNPYQIQTLGNCYVLHPPVDSYGGILKADQELAQLMKRRAGVGLSLDNIRPKGLATNNAAKTTDGIAVFMERFSNTCREVAQSGRRGAELQILSVHHPEIETFINIKRDKTKVTGANISVKLTDEFMQAVKNDVEYEQRWPIDSDRPHISKMVRAKYIWDQIIDAAWYSAEPGIFYIDTQLKYSPADIYAEINEDWKTTATNPCQPGWATVLTPNGISTFDNINIGDIIWSGSRWTKIVNKVCNGVKPVYAFKTTAGTFYGTEQHRIVSNGEKVEVGNAESIDFTTCEIGISNTLEMQDDMRTAIIDGLIIGDGMMHKASNNLVVLLIGSDDQDYFTDPDIKDLIIKHRPGIGETAWLVKTTIKHLDKTYNRCVPDKYKFGNFDLSRMFLRGLYSANGSIVGKRITLKASSFQIIEDVQIMLSSLGIRSYYTTNKPHDVEFKNGIYESKESYDLCIGTRESRQRFIDMIGFVQKYKQEKAIESCNIRKSFKPLKVNYDIISKQFIDNEVVYDITVDTDEHTYWSGGALTSNCGEIGMGVDSCRLTLINLYSFVKNKFLEDSSFDFKKLSEISIKAQRIMDDVVDLELEAMDKIINKINSDPEPEDVKAIELNLWLKLKKNCIDGRRTGLGITGLGDTLAALGITYGSKESIEMTEEIYKTLALGAYKSTCIMAKERGAFPIFNNDLEKDHPFLNRIFKSSDEGVIDLYNQYGRRNIALTTTAPTGTISTLTQTTSGIEPAFLLKYDRYKKVNPNDKNVTIDRVDALGDAWQKYTIYHHGFAAWMYITGKTDIKDSPYYKATSNDLDWETGVELQAAAQKWVCHSISRTQNIPEDSSRDLVANIYMKAWESGCKGFTVYRDGCRDGVLVASEDNEEKKDNIQNNRKVISRPETLHSETHKMKIDLGTGVKNAYLTVSFFPGTKKPYEIFINGSIFGLEDSALQLLELSTRNTSLMLRHDIPINFICEQLDKIGGQYLFSIPTNIAKILRKYCSETEIETVEMEDYSGPEEGEAVEAGPDAEINNLSKCPKCRKRTYAIQEGCGKCLDFDCAYSGCG